MTVRLNMMTARRAAFDRMADAARDPGLSIAESFVDAGTGSWESIEDLAARVADFLVVPPRGPGSGAAVVGGLRLSDVEESRRYHCALFAAVWKLFSATQCLSGSHAVKARVISDGRIPTELYGSQWSFKRLHVDRDALLFSHLYGPVSGFAGGDLLLAAARPYLRRHGYRFADVFEWSDESTPGSKPVLRAEFVDELMREHGETVTAPDLDRIIFVNNTPEAGVLHGIRPLLDLDPATFMREYHRCSVSAR
jgi:hypothetical protein